MAGSRGKAGEFFLILFSVFLALAGERWVSGRSDRSLASEYTSDLVADLRGDSVQHAYWTGMTTSRQHALERLLAELNGTAPPLTGAEELATLYYAQVVPIPDFRRATYQDLVGSGNLRLLDPGVRRSVVAYQAALDRLAQGVGLTGLGKPRFADLVPASTRAYVTGNCAGRPAACGFGLAESALADMPAPEVEALRSWRAMSDVRMELQRVLNETHAFRRGFEGLGPRLWEALEVLEGSGH